MVVKEFMYFCVSQVSSQNYGLVCAMSSGSFPTAGSLRVYVCTKGFLGGCIWDLYLTVFGRVNPEAPYMDSTSVASHLIAEVIGGWRESFSLCLLSYSNPHCCCHMRYNMHVIFDP